MPVDRGLGEQLARTLVDIYRDVEDKLVTEIATRLRQGLDAPDWAETKLREITRLRRYAEQLLATVLGDLRGTVEQTLVLAYARGGQAALDEIARIVGASAGELAAIRAAAPNVDAVQPLVFALTSALSGTHVPILRWTLDSYRAVIASAAPHVLLGTQTRLQAAQFAWEQFLTAGITGFRDRAGRNWELASYVEMATRTATAHAAVQGHLDRLGENGMDLVIVSNAPQECALCRPFEGKVLHRTVGGERTIEVEHAIVDDRMVSVRVAGSVTEAVAQGLMHPNCRHSLSAYLPGVTKAPTHTADPEGNEARQQLRYLERGVRKWKRREAGALDPLAKRAAALKVREWQARIREHLAANSGLLRQSHRERIGTAR